MGQVWRATDTTLGRQVAIKILPEAFSTDPDRLARFEREAKTLASSTDIQGASQTNTAYDLHPDGKRVATAVAPDQGSVVRDKVVFVFNFGDYLRTIAPGTK